MRTREEGGSILSEIETEAWGGDDNCEFSQAVFSLLANYIFTASENYIVHTVHTCCMHFIMCLCAYLN